MLMEWYVIHSKPRQEARALLNLQNQGYSCYLPVCPTQKLRNGKLKTQLDPLFSRYLFIQLSLAHSGQSWAPIRSTLGVSTLLMFGNEPARVAPQLIDALKTKEQSVFTEPVALHQPGDKLHITEGPFAGLEAVYQMADGKARAFVLIDILSRLTKLKVAIETLRKCA